MQIQYRVHPSSFIHDPLSLIRDIRNAANTLFIETARVAPMHTWVVKRAMHNIIFAMSILKSHLQVQLHSSACAKGAKGQTG